MASANDETVLGDFNDREITVAGITSRFLRKDGGYYVRTDDADGELHEYRIAYTFGWYPLQQYLIEFPNGRLLSLGIAWDSRPAEQGGQRWFHLYPGEVSTLVIRCIGAAGIRPGTINAPSATPQICKRTTN